MQKNIFDKGDISTGVELLKKATCKGHTVAHYLMNIITLRFEEHQHFAAVNSHDVFRVNEIFLATLMNDDQFELSREKVPFSYPYTHT